MTGKAKYSKLLPTEVADSKKPLQKAVVNLDDVTISISKVHLTCFFLSLEIVFIFGDNLCIFFLCRMAMGIS